MPRGHACVHVHTCMYTCMCTCMHAGTCTHMHMCTHVHTRVCTCTREHTCVSTCLHSRVCVFNSPQPTRTAPAAQQHRAVTMPSCNFAFHSPVHHSHYLCVERHTYINTNTHRTRRECSLRPRFGPTQHMPRRATRDCLPGAALCGAESGCRCSKTGSRLYMEPSAPKPGAPASCLPYLTSSGCAFKKNIARRHSNLPPHRSTALH
jgi:hypothetical protein